MKLDPSIIALKDFRSTRVFRLKLARYSTAVRGPEYKRECMSTLQAQHGTQLWVLMLRHNIDIKRKNRLLKVCYVPTTSTTFLAFLLFFMLWPLAVLKKPTRQAVPAVKKSILLRCLWMYTRRDSGRDKKAARFYNSDFYNTF
jgi:hypothetical protein